MSSFQELDGPSFFWNPVSPLRAATASEPVSAASPEDDVTVVPLAMVPANKRGQSVLQKILRHSPARLLPPSEHTADIAPACALETNAPPWHQM